MRAESIRRDVAQYYAGKLQQFGPTARGVDWNGEASQNLRFRQLVRLLDDVGPDQQISVLDVGCGYGAMADFLRPWLPRLSYTGFDISPEMVSAAERLLGTSDRIRFTSDRNSLHPGDFAFASGVFNVRLGYPVGVWQDYVVDSLREIDVLAGRGWAVNFLTSYSDSGRMRGDLYYAEPTVLFDWCKRNVSPRVALLHDYELYEFTLIVRKP
jgi:SAM-dependent methyltransferase